MPDRAPSFFEQLGGELVLRAIIDRFVDQLFDDVMIGFLFQRTTRERLKAKEFEFAANHLGAPIAYTGRPLAEAHKPHRILAGQFLRRLQILREILEQFGVDRQIREHWIAHTESLQSLVTVSDDCEI